MSKQHFFLFLVIVILNSKPVLVPMNNLYTPYITTTDMMTFTRMYGQHQVYSTVISSYPVPQNATTTFTIKIISSTNSIILGCGEKRPEYYPAHHMGQIPNNIGYYAVSGQKMVNGVPISYGTPALIGDLLTIKVDLHSNAMNVEYLKNGNSLGIAFGGLKNWRNIYLGISLGEQGGTAVVITEYTVSY